MGLSLHNFFANLFWHYILCFPFSYFCLSINFFLSFLFCISLGEGVRGKFTRYYRKHCTILLMSSFVARNTSRRSSSARGTSNCSSLMFFQSARFRFIFISCQVVFVSLAFEQRRFVLFKPVQFLFVRLLNCFLKTCKVGWEIVGASADGNIRWISCHGNIVNSLSFFTGRFPEI